MRLFIATEFKRQERSFRLLQGSLAGAKMAFPISFHLTYLFLGDVSDAEGIVRKLSSVRFSGFSARIFRIGAFPSLSRPRVVWCGFEDEAPFVLLHKKISGALGLSQHQTKEAQEQKKGFVPHVTIARIKKATDVKELQQSIARLRIDEPAHISSFSLIRSRLTPKGALYETIMRFMASGV